MRASNVKERRRKSVKASPWKALEAFRTALRTTYGDGLRGLILYGSLARGEWTSDSDIDVAVLLDNALDVKAERDRIWEIAWSLSDKYDELIEPMVWGEREFQRGGWPLHLNIRREGWFIMPEDQPTGARDLLGIARQSLEEAKALIRLESERGAVSRGYYAMFNAEQAALLSKGITRSRHKGVHSAFGYYFVRNRAIDPKLHALVEQAYDKRIIADYSAEQVTLDDAREIVTAAETLLAAVEKLLSGEES